jgi:polyhydroxybutyrate depolymerase
MLRRDPRTSVLSVAGLEREYLAFAPTSLSSSQPIPVVFVFHGGTGTARGAAVQTGFDAEAERRGFLIVYPQGLRRTWNAGSCCGPAARLGVDDVAFVSALLDELGRAHRVDPDRVFATGISNGGMMAARLACDLPGRFAAIAPVAATLSTACDRAEPVSVLHIHGTADRNVPIDGGFGPRALTPVDHLPLEEVLARWRAIDGCDAEPAVERCGAVTRRTWSCGRGGTEVQAIVIDGGGHSWPGGQRMARVLDAPSNELDATAEIGRFFAQHPRDAGGAGRA